MTLAVDAQVVSALPYRAMGIPSECRGLADVPKRWDEDSTYYPGEKERSRLRIWSCIPALGRGVVGMCRHCRISVPGSRLSVRGSIDTAATIAFRGLAGLGQGMTGDSRLGEGGRGHVAPFYWGVFCESGDGTMSVSVRRGNILPIRVGTRKFG